MFLMLIIFIFCLQPCNGALSLDALVANADAALAILAHADRQSLIAGTNGLIDFMNDHRVAQALVAVQHKPAHSLPNLTQNPKRTCVVQQKKQITKRTVRRKKSKQNDPEYHPSMERPCGASHAGKRPRKPQRNISFLRKLAIPFPAIDPTTDIPNTPMPVHAQSAPLAAAAAVPVIAVKVQGSSKFSCILCGTKLRTNRFEEHQEIHQEGPDRPFACDKCPSYFTRQRYLTVHNMTNHKI